MSLNPFHILNPLRTPKRRYVHWLAGALVKHRFVWFAIICFVATLEGILPCVAAKETVYAFTGEITEVNDPNGWFQSSIGMGASVAGRWNLFDSGYQAVKLDGNDFQYEYNRPGKPKLPVELTYTIDGNRYQKGRSTFTYRLHLLDNSDGSYLPEGDHYLISGPLEFPSNFLDLSGDPVLDPDSTFAPYVTSNLDFHDPSGSALNSAAFTTMAPDLANFGNAFGHLYIADINGNPNYAEATFRILTVAVVPEPGTLLLLLLGGIFTATIAPRRQAIHRPMWRFSD